MKRRHRDPWARWQDLPDDIMRDLSAEFGRALDRVMPSTVCRELHEPRLPAAQPVGRRS